MDIIASHQWGLIEQLEVEAAALGGAPRDSVQRAITCHHVADMLGLSHGYALLAAEAALSLDDALGGLERAAKRWRWSLDRAQRRALGERVAEFAVTMRTLDAQRTAGVLMAYRLVATPGLSGEAERRLDPELLACLRAALAERGAADAGLRGRLFAAHRRWAEEAFGERVDAAVAALRWPARDRRVQAAVAALLIPARAHERAEKRGPARSEAQLKRKKRLPEGFAANPAQAFFKLQRQVGERRRRAADGDHWSADEAVRLAA